MLQLSMYTDAHGEAEQHDPQHEPRRRWAHGLFGNAAGIKGGRGEIAQDDGGARARN